MCIRERVCRGGSGTDELEGARWIRCRVEEGTKYMGCRWDEVEWIEWSLKTTALDPVCRGLGVLAMGHALNIYPRAAASLASQLVFS